MSAPASPGLQPSAKPLEVGDDLAQRIERLAMGLPADPPSMAPIRWPSAERLAVQMVDVRELERLHEYQSDATLMMGLCLTAAGLAGGLLPSAIHTVPFDVDPLWASLVVAAGAVAAVTGLLWHRVARRERNVRRAFFEPEAG